MNERGTLVSIVLIGGSLVTYLGGKMDPALPEGAPDTTWLLAVGLFLIISGILIFQSKTAYIWFNHKIENAAGWLGVFRWQILLLGLSPIFIVLSSVSAGFAAKMYSPLTSIGSWVAGISLIVLGGYTWGEEKPVFSKKTVLFAALITYVAFLIRGVGTGHFPVILTGDEGSAGLSAINFINGEWNNIFITSWFSFPSLFSYIQSLSIRMLGQTTEALRILSAITGALTVTATYFCGKAMFDERTGRLAALSLTALHFHIHFSRLGLNNIWDGLGFTITIGSLWYAWENNKRFAYLLAGLALGFSQYYYVSSRGLFGIVIFCMLLTFLFQRRRFYQSAPGIVLMIAVTAAVLFPLIRYYIHEPNQFLAPFARVSTMNNNFDTSFEAVWKQIVIGVQAYTYIPTRSWYKPETPILRPILSTLFYIGIIFLLLNKRDSRFVLLSCWLLLFGLIGGLSESPPAAQRYVAAMPACALIIGVGLSKIMGIFENIWANHEKTIARLGYTIMIIAMVSDLSFYFIEYLGIDIIENSSSNGMIAQQLANHLKDEPAGTQVIFLYNPRMGYYSIPSLSYLTPQIKGIDAPEDWASFDSTQLNSQKIIFVSLVEDNNIFQIVQSEFPGREFTSTKAWNGEILFWLYEYEKN